MIEFAAHDLRRLGDEHLISGVAVEPALDEFRRNVDVQAERVAVQRGLPGDEAHHQAGE